MSPGLQRRLATGVNALLVALLVVAIVGVLVEVADRTRVRWDLSFEGTATLRPHTRSVLDRLEQTGTDVVITAFSAQRRDEEAWFRDRSVRDLLRELERASPRVRARFVDFDRDRLTAERLGVERYGTVVVEARGGRMDLIDREVFRSRGKGDDRTVDFFGEAQIVRAIEALHADDARVVYTLYGHGERRVFDRGIGELRELGTLVHHQGWTAKVLDLLRDRPADRAPEVPGDAAAVLLIGATATVSPVEEEALRDYLRRGGSVGVFVDPGGFVPDLLTQLGVAVPAGVVLDAVSVYPHVDRPLLRYRSHPVTRDLAAGEVATVVSTAAPLQIAPVDGVRAEPLLVTSAHGWVERGTERPPTFHDGVDLPGPVTVGVALTVGAPHPLAGGRVLVVGDADIASDALLREGPGNATFLANSLRWLLRADDRMGRVGPPSRARNLAMTAGQLSTVRGLLVGGLPLVTLLLGAVVHVVRRRT